MSQDKPAFATEVSDEIKAWAERVGFPALRWLAPILSLTKSQGERLTKADRIMVGLDYIYGVLHLLGIVSTAPTRVDGPAWTDEYWAEWQRLNGPGVARLKQELDAISSFSGLEREQWVQSISPFTPIAVDDSITKYKRVPKSSLTKVTVGTSEPKPRVRQTSGHSGQPTTVGRPPALAPSSTTVQHESAANQWAFQRAAELRQYWSDHRDTYRSLEDMRRAAGVGSVDWKTILRLDNSHPITNVVAYDMIGRYFGLPAFNSADVPIIKRNGGFPFRRDEAAWQAWLVEKGFAEDGTASEVDQQPPASSPEDAPELVRGQSEPEPDQPVATSHELVAEPSAVANEVGRMAAALFDTMLTAAGNQTLQILEARQNDESRRQAAFIADIKAAVGMEWRNMRDAVISRVNRMVKDALDGGPQATEALLADNRKPLVRLMLRLMALLPDEVPHQETAPTVTIPDGMDEMTYHAMRLATLILEAQDVGDERLDAIAKSEVGQAIADRMGLFRLACTPSATDRATAIRMMSHGRGIKRLS